MKANILLVFRHNEARLLVADALSNDYAVINAATGEVLWSEEHLRGGHNSPEDLLVMKGLAWSGAIAGTKDSGAWVGRDVHTGEVVSEFEPDVETYWFHHR